MEINTDFPYIEIKPENTDVATGTNVIKEEISSKGKYDLT